MHLGAKTSKFFQNSTPPQRHKTSQKEQLQNSLPRSRLNADPLRLEFQQIHSEIELPSGKRRHTSSNELSIQAGIRVRPFCR